MTAKNSDALCDRCRSHISMRDGHLDYTVYRTMRMGHDIKEITLTILCAPCSTLVDDAMEPLPA